MLMWADARGRCEGMEGPDLSFVTYLQSCTIIIIIYDELC